MTTDSKIVERIRKLLTLANDAAATENEAETALQKARQLMLDHKIEALPEHVAEKLVRFGDIRKGMGERWTLVLGMAAGRLYGCKVVTYKSSESYAFVGRPDSMEVAELTFAYLQREVEKRYKLALKVLADAGATNKQVRADLRRSFKTACAETLFYRVGMIIDAQKVPSNERALVVIKNDEALVDELMAEQKIKKGKALKTIKSGIGTMAGHIAGKQIKLQDEVK